jgi:hypothetical protein
LSFLSTLALGFGLSMGTRFGLTELLIASGVLLSCLKGFIGDLGVYFGLCLGNCTAFISN